MRAFAAAYLLVLFGVSPALAQAPPPSRRPAPIVPRVVQPFTTLAPKIVCGIDVDTRRSAD
jgi:hypothetical protein